MAEGYCNQQKDHYYNQDTDKHMHPNSRTMASLTTLAFICFLFSAYAYSKISGQMQEWVPSIQNFSDLLIIFFPQGSNFTSFLSDLIM